MFLRKHNVIEKINETHSKKFKVQNTEPTVTQWLASTSTNCRKWEFFNYLERQITPSLDLHYARGLLTVNVASSDAK